MHPLMKCGCVAQGICDYKAGVKLDPPIPVCIVHDCYDIVDERPNLDGRTAHCAYGKHAPRPSSFDLPFFEYLGPGSREAIEVCTCGYSRAPHFNERKFRIPASCKGFTPKGGAEFDRYYCGCRGWD